jgi:hypothetical protein
MLDPSALLVNQSVFRSGFDHFIQFGQFEDRDSIPEFDTSFYLTLNPDVAAAVQRDELTGLQHFIQFGQFEGRDPIAVFDTPFYLQRNPDVAAAVQRDELTGIEHFVEFGQFEGRDPIARFNTSYYLQQSPDVAAAINNGAISSAIEHYILFGLTERRLSSPPDPEDNLATASDLGTLSSTTRTLRDSVGNANPADIYRFNLNTTSNFGLVLDGLSADADLELIQDRNNNGVVEDEDTLAFSVQLGNSPEAIDVNGLVAGNYFVRVAHVPFNPALPSPAPQGDTNYNLRLTVS